MPKAKTHPHKAGFADMERMWPGDRARLRGVQIDDCVIISPQVEANPIGEGLFDPLAYTSPVMITQFFASATAKLKFEEPDPDELVSWIQLEAKRQASRALIDGRSVEFATPESKFEALALTWAEKNAGQSVVNYYQLSLMQIIGMGREALPFIFERIARGEGKWVFALKCITGEEAETPDMQGNPQRVIDAWLKWGVSHGHVWRGR